MTFDAVASHAVSVGAVAWPSGRVTIVVKLTFVLGAGEVFALAPDGEVEPLLLDVFDDAGALLYPSDFAPYKPACDVVVIGADARERTCEGSLSVGPLVRHVEPGTGLGPRESFGPLGDPLAPEAVEQWSSGALDVTRFHAAPPASRLPFTTTPLAVDYRRGAVSMRGVLHGPLPNVVLTTPEGVLLTGPIPMLLDTIALAPSQGRLVIVTRGIVDPAPGAAGVPRIVVDLSLHPAASPTGAWRALAVADPRRLRVAQELAADDTTTTTAGVEDVSTVDRRETAPAGHAVIEETAFGAAPAGAALPFAPRAVTPATREEATRTVASSRARIDPLPFAGTATPARRSSSSILDLQTLRAAGREPVRPAWEATDGTAVQPRSEAVPPVGPPDVVAPAAMAPLAVASPAAIAAVSAPPVTVAAVSAAPRPAPAADAAPLRSTPAATPPADDAQVERVATIQRELWKGERSLKDVLAEHGLDEAAWRSLKRATGNR